MPDKVKPIPDGYNGVTPYLIVDDAARAIEFYKEAFGASEVYRFDAPGGRVGHADVKIGDTHVMLADEHTEVGARSPKTIGGSPVSLSLYVGDVDATVAKAVEAGARVIRPVANQFYGDRTGGVEDPFGHVWYVATHVEDVSDEEMRRRAAAAPPAAEREATA